MPQTSTTASRIIDFLSRLHGLDDFPVPTGNAAIDLRTGMIIRPSENYPDGEMLVLEYAPGAMTQSLGCTEVHTRKLVNLYMLHHAEMEAMENSDKGMFCFGHAGKVKRYFDHISQHFSFKTGMQ